MALDSGQNVCHEGGCVSAQLTYMVLSDDVGGGGGSGGDDAPKIMGIREYADDVLCLAKSEVDFYLTPQSNGLKLSRRLRLHKVTEGLGFLPHSSFSMF